MYIKEYSCNRFAGLKDQNIKFQDGMNVILGPNEAGKSTIVEGIHGTLFKNIKLKNNNRDDKDFRSKFMPQPDGDFIDGKIILDVNGEEYVLMKEWGSSEKLQLITPNGDIIGSEKRINEILSEILQFGEGTYSSIVFAKQKDIKESIERMLEDNETTSEIGSTIRNTIMELDGVSVEDLKNSIELEIDRLLKRWDIDKNYPQNNRGINNPYKTGYGDVLKCFYAMEGLKEEMDRANKAELDFEETCKKLNENKEAMMKLKLKKEQMEKIENDITKRSILEPRIEMLEKEIENINAINKEWPRKGLLLEEANKKIEEIAEKRKILNEEKENAKKVQEKLEIKNIISKVENLNSEKEKVSLQIKGIGDISKDDLNRLDDLNKKILKIEAVFDNNVIVGKLNKMKASGNLWITKDFGDKEKINIGEEFSANQFVKIQYEDMFELELQVGSSDFEELKNEYKCYKDEFQNLLDKLNVKSLEEARNNKNNLLDLMNQETSMNTQIDLLLEGKSFDELKERMESLKDIDTSRNIEDVEKDIDILKDEEIECRANKNSLDEAIKDWKEKYIDEDHLLEILVGYKMEKREKECEIEKLAPLPEEYESPEEFKEELTSIREEYEERQNEHDNIKSEYYESQNNLPETSYEELSRDRDCAKIEFEKALNRSKKLLKIRDAFYKTQSDMDKNTFTPLIEDLSKYLSILTNDNYKVENIDEDFTVKLQKKNNVEMPIDLLSSGTYDCVALALRFSLLKYLFNENHGYVILDDCLVDLDPDRRDMAIKLINEFAKDNQVIFTTCNSETAKLFQEQVAQGRFVCHQLE